MAWLLAVALFLQDPSVDELVERLGHSDLAVREQAYAKLKSLGKKAVPELEKAAKSDDAQTAQLAGRLLAIHVIRERLGAVVDLRPGIEERLFQAEPAEWTCEFLMTPADGFLPEALQGVRSPDELRQVLAAATSRKLTRARAEARPLLVHADREIRRSAVMYLAAIGDRESGPSILKLLMDPDSGVRDRAASALGELEIREAVPALTKLLEDPDTEVVRSAAVSLGRLGSRQGISKVARQLASFGPTVRHNAILALVQLKAVDELPLIRLMVKDPDSSVRDAAFQALGTLDPGGFPAELEEMLRMPGDHRWGAVPYLVRLGSPKAVSVLGAYLEDPSPGLRQNALEGLEKLGARAELADFVKRPTVRDELLREDAAEALGKLGDKDALPVLLRRLEKPPKDGCAATLAALSIVGSSEQGAEVAAHLKTCRDVEGSRHAKVLLARWGGAESMASAKAMLDDVEPWVRATGIELLSHLESDDVPALLAERLKDESEAVRAVAAEALGRRGSLKEAASLRPLLADPDLPVRLAAVRSLGRLRDTESAEAIAGLLKKATGHAAVEMAVALGHLGGAGAREAIQDSADRGNGLTETPLVRLGAKDRIPSLLSTMRQGAADGIRQELGRLEVLNAFRSPDAWKALTERRMTRTLTGTGLEILEALAKEAGLALEFEAEASNWLSLPARIHAPAGGVPVAQLLEEILAAPGFALPVYRHSMALPEMPPPDLTFILEPGRLRVLTSAAALPFWEKWHEAR